MLGHILSEEQSKDGSDGVSDDGRLTIVQCHHYHWPPLLDLYQSSIGILPPLRCHQQTCILIIAITNQHHVLSTAAQPEPHHAPHMFHVPGQSYCVCTSSRGHTRGNFQVMWNQHDFSSLDLYMTGTSHGCDIHMLI